MNEYCYFINNWGLKYKDNKTNIISNVYIVNERKKDKDGWKIRKQNDSI